MKERKKQGRKLVSLLIILTLILSSMPTMAWAAISDRYGVDVGQNGVYAYGDKIGTIAWDKEWSDTAWVGLYDSVDNVGKTDASLAWYYVKGDPNSFSGDDDFNNEWANLTQHHRNSGALDVIDKEFKMNGTGNKTYYIAMFADSSVNSAGKYNILDFNGDGVGNSSDIKAVTVKPWSFSLKNPPADNVYNCGSTISVNADYPGRYTDTFGHAWIGIYRLGETPGDPGVSSLDWKQMNAAGTFDLKPSKESLRDATQSYQIHMIRHTSEYDESIKSTIDVTIKHTYSSVVTEPTCLAGGYTTYTCTNCGYSYTDDETAKKDHLYEYTASGNVITEKCNRGCKHSATATLSGATDQTYTGEKIEPLTVSYNNWAAAKDLKVSYTNNTNVGTAKGSITKDSATANNTFKIVKAPNQWTNGPTMNGWVYGKTASTPSAKAKFGDWTVKYKVKGAADSTYTTTKPSTPGDYVALFTVAETDNYYGLSTPVEFTISKAQIPGVNVVPYEGEYDGKNHSISVTAPDAKISYSTDGSTFSEKNPAFKDAGTYTVYYKIEKDHHETITGSALVIISKRGVTVTAADKSKVYDTADPALTWDVTTGSVVEGENLDINISREAGEDVGEYTITVGQDADKNANYAITFKAGKFVISQADNEWTTTPSIEGWTYGETPKEAEAAAKYGAPVVEYRPAGSTGAFTTEVPTDAGEYEVRFTVAETKNYRGLEKVIPLEIKNADMSADVSAKGWTGPYDGIDHEITVTAPDDATITYSTSEEGPYTAEEPKYADADTYTVWYKVEKDNYDPVVGSAVIEIAKAKVTVSPDANQGKVYNDPDPALKWSVTDGSVVEGESLDINISREAGENVGTYDITVGQDEGKNKNYAITFEKGIFTISQAENEWTVTPSIEGWTYGETPMDPVSDAKFGEPVVEYRPAGSTEPFTTDVPTDAGDYEVRFTVPATDNYTGLEETLPLVIKNADMSADVSAEGWTGTYDGENHGITVTAPEGAKVTYSTSETGTFGEDELKYKDAGTYTVWYKVELKNFDTVVKSAEIVIKKAEVTVTAEDTSKIYGEEDPAFTSKTTGALVTGETITDLTFERQAGEDVGAYTITVGQAADANPNYDVTFVDGTFTIKEAQLHATVAQKGTLTYDEGKALTPEVTTTDDARLNQKVTFTYSMSEDGTYGDMPTFTKAGTYTVYFKADAPNHKGTSGSFVVTVEKAKVEKPKADDTKFVYNGTEQKYGIPANDVYTVTNDKRTDAGSQDVKVALKDKDNYEWTDGTQDDLTYEFKIAPLGIYADWGKTEDLVYNGEDQLPTPKPTGLKGDDTCDLTAKWTDDKEGVGVMPGTWDAGIVDVSNPNYYIINDETPVIIVKAPQEKPEVSGVDETIKDKNDGIIKDVDDKMEYRKDGEDTWTPITEDEVKNLPDDKYFVRYEETETHLPSPETEVIIGPGRDLTVTVPEEQPGYELTTEDDKLPWNGDTVIDFTLEEGYQKTDDFAVLVNGEEVELDENDQYIIKDAQEDIVITVVGVEKMPAVEAPEAEDDSQTPTTGDSNNIWMWLAVLMAAGGTAVVTEKRRRRQ